MPAASPAGQQQHPRPFTSLMHGQAGNPTPAMQGQPGGTQVASQTAMYSPRGPPNSMAQPRPQLGVPQMVQGQPTPGQVPGQALGQQPGMPKGAPGQLQYHPPLGEPLCLHAMLTLALQHLRPATLENCKEPFHVTSPLQHAQRRHPANT